MKPKRSISPYLFLATILWFGVMCILFFMPGNDVPSIGLFEILHLDKVAHVGLFLVFVILSYLTISYSVKSRKSRFFLLFGVIIFSVGFGILVEYLQRDYISGRSFDIFDWVADTSGVILALILLGSGLLRKVRIQD